MHSFDLIVIGTGSAGNTIAHSCRKAGWNVAIIDSRPFGGTCVLRGCDPKKVLLGAADALDWVRRMSGKGIYSNGARIDWPALMRFKRTFTDPVAAQREKAFQDAGIVAFHGSASFTGPETIVVGDETLTAPHIALATGAAPAPLNIPGEDLLTISDSFLELDQLPHRIAFVGGGYIAFEFAHLSLRAGADVTIIHRAPRPLEKFDADLVERLVAYTRELGAHVHLSTVVRGIERTTGGLRVLTAPEIDLEADLVVHAAGRAPNIEGLNLPAANIEAEKRGIKVNEFLQSVSNPAVYAAGDCAASGAPLTPAAGYGGNIVAANLLNGNHLKTNFTGIASVAFTIPPIAAVGMTEEAARASGLDFEVRHADTSQWYSARRINETCSGYKTIVEKGSGRILGAHLLGSHAEDAINLFALAIHAGLRVEDIKNVLYAYPTAESDLQYML
jgi:glutathione reductase (NADPH)